MYKNYKIRLGLLYFTNYHIHGYRDFRPHNKMLDEGTNPTKDTVKRQNSMKENSDVKEQYSTTSIFGRIYQHCTTHE